MTATQRALLASLPLLAAVGCSSKLETGYEPHALGSTAAERRGYYASPFTPEATVSPGERTDEVRNMRRPGQQMYR